MSPIRVLLADDEAEFTSAVCKVLGRRGMLVETRTDADGALAAIGQQRFDVVVLDVKMPGKSGIVCLDQIRERHPSVPVILLTGHQALEEEQDGLGRGAVAYLLKPLPIQDLIHRIVAACEQAPAANHDRPDP